MPSIVFPTDTEDVIDDIRDAIGRDVTFYTATLSRCWACNLDPITNTSTDSFCTVCSGVYWISILSGVSINAHVTWGNVDDLGWHTGGQVLEGDCRLQIKYTLSNLNVVESVHRDQPFHGTYVEVDGKQMEINTKILRGVPQINRILIDLIEKES